MCAPLSTRLPEQAAIRRRDGDVREIRWAHCSRRDADVVVTMDGQRRELRNAGLFARDGMIEKVGPTADCRRAPTSCSNCGGISCFPASSTVTIISTRFSFATCRPGKTPTVSLAPSALPRLGEPDAGRHARRAGGGAELATPRLPASNHGYVFKNGCKVDDQQRRKNPMPASFACRRRACRPASPLAGRWNAIEASDHGREDHGGSKPADRARAGSDLRSAN